MRTGSCVSHTRWGGASGGGREAVGIVSTLFLGALTGSSIPCISALIPLLVPRLERYGYEKRYTAAVICSCCFLGYLIPPSVPALLYCLIAQQSVSAMFLATVIPGLLIAGGYAILNYVICPRYMNQALVRETLTVSATFSEAVKELGRSTWVALPALGCPALIMVGIYGGICTPNEAGAIAAVYCMVIGYFVYRDLTLEGTRRALHSSILSIGVVLVLIATGTVFGRYLIKIGVAQMVANYAMTLFHTKGMILLSMNVVLLVLGMFIDGTPILVLAVPLFLPLMQDLGVNLVHLGSIVILNIGLGVITPPFAMSLFVGTRLSGCTYMELAKIVLVFFFLVGIPVLLLTTYIPALSCWLPTLVLGPEVVGPW
ncbi:TRAP transporter large permease [Aminiphilus sp.]|uniref:TRAP transporter large permease n=1 Tax=Aminiphilus sp. TaxID=1872488 RepID=UPI0026190E97|nr:TRAP transporter large permease [Aminiphilus sp.]